MKCHLQEVSQAKTWRKNLGDIQYRTTKRFYSKAKNPYKNILMFCFVMFSLSKRTFKLLVEYRLKIYQVIPLSITCIVHVTCEDARKKVNI